MNIFWNFQVLKDIISRIGLNVYLNNQIFFRKNNLLKYPYFLMDFYKIKEVFESFIDKF